MSLDPGSLLASHAEFAAAGGGFDRVIERFDGRLRVGCEYPLTLVISHSASGYRIEPSAPWIARRVGPQVHLSDLSVEDLRLACGRIYALLRSMPTTPLEAFLEQTRKLPASTAAERLVVERVGQAIFRKALDDFWGEQCPLTDVRDRALLRASHIRAWSECGNDAERLDVHNGVLLAAHLDAAFDKHLITFDERGRLLYGPSLSPWAREVIGRTLVRDDIALDDSHQPWLAEHRARTFNPSS